MHSTSKGWYFLLFLIPASGCTISEHFDPPLITGPPFPVTQHHVFHYPSSSSLSYLPLVLLDGCALCLELARHVLLHQAQLEARVGGQDLQDEQRGQQVASLYVTQHLLNLHAALSFNIESVHEERLHHTFGQKISGHGGHKSTGLEPCIRQVVDTIA